ncbi:MAG: hypothetical protein P8049_08085 [Gemmatimonadota bacterium]
MCAVAEEGSVGDGPDRKRPSDEGYVTIDGFRFDQNGKIVEHGDPMRQIPEESARIPTRRKSQAVERPEP